MDDELLADAKKHALDTGRTLTALIQDAVVELIHRERAQQSPRILKFPVFGDPGDPPPPVDINSNKAVLDFLDDVDGVQGL